MHTQSAPVTHKEREWQQVKGQIIAKYGTLKACADAIGCAPPSLRVSILFGSLPGVREKLLANLAQPEPMAA